MSWGGEGEGKRVGDKARKWGRGGGGHTKLEEYRNLSLVRMLNIEIAFQDSARHQFFVKAKRIAYWMKIRVG